MNVKHGEIIEGKTRNEIKLGLKFTLKPSSYHKIYNMSIQSIKKKEFVSDSLNT